MEIQSVKLLKALTKGLKGHITRALKLLNKAFLELSRYRYMDAEVAHNTFNRMLANFNSAVQKWEDSIGLLRPAIQVALAITKDMPDPVKSKAEFDMLEELEVFIETKENEIDKLMEKITKMQRVAAAVMADRQEKKDKAM